jgi:acyl-CoA reductase-like NAD-dependent aldehyde dehydrogenase
MFGEILVTLEKLQWTCLYGEKALKPSRRPTNLLMCYKNNSVVYEPLGVVAACVSWNYPFHNFISPVISGLFAGNAVIVKPSELTCWSTLYYLEIVKGALKACGLSEDLVQLVVTLPTGAEFFTSHPGLSHLTFIGSREIAHKVCASAAQVLTPVTVELGGKDPVIVLDDSRTRSSIDDVIPILMRGTFQASGQNCIGIERIVAIGGIHDQMLAKLLPKVRVLKLGTGFEEGEVADVGAMISSRNFVKLEALIQDAVKAGATLHCGGRRAKRKGIFFEPTLLSGVTPDMSIAKAELFAPVMVLMRAETIDEAIKIANSTLYGLGASVFGHDQNSMQRCVREIKAGMVAANDFAAYYACSLPFGGVKGSGYGRFSGEEGLRAVSNVKAVCEDAWWATKFGIQTKIPGKLQYPVSRDGWEVVKGVVGTGYALSWAEMVSNVVGLLGALMRPDKRQQIKPA